MRKLIILLLVLLMLFTPVLAEEALVEGICEYVLTNEGAIITLFCLDENVTDVIVIPAELGGMPVISVAEGALTYYWGEIAFEAALPHISNEDGFLIDTLTSTLLYSAPSSTGQPLPPVCRLGTGCTINWVTGWAEMDVIIPEGVEEIAAYAFYDCEAKSLSLPESLRLIETCAFESFDVVDLPIIIPEGVQEVQYGAFGLSYQFGEWGLYETPDMIVEKSDTTHYETYEEYVTLTGDDSFEIQ